MGTQIWGGLGRQRIRGIFQSCDSVRRTTRFLWSFEQESCPPCTRLAPHSQHDSIPGIPKGPNRSHSLFPRCPTHPRGSSPSPESGTSKTSPGRRWKTGMLLGTYGPRVSEASQEQETHLRHKERREVGRGWKRSMEKGWRRE